MREWGAKGDSVSTDEMSKDTVTISLAIPPGTLEGAARRLGTGTARDTATSAVTANLGDLVKGLVALGFVASTLPDGKLSKRRPRRVDRATWDALVAASGTTGLPASDLLRAALEVSSRPGPEPINPEGGKAARRPQAKPARGHGGGKENQPGGKAAR